MAEYMSIHKDMLHERLDFLVKHYRKRSQDDANPIYGQVADDLLDAMSRDARHEEAEHNG
jgi:hypothetical protein